MDLRDDVVLSRRVENFRALCTGEKQGMCYKNTAISVVNWYGGRIVTGGTDLHQRSIYGGKFEAERNQLKWDAAGLLVVSTGGNLCGSDFCITTGVAQYVPDNVVVFGQCRQLDVLHKIQQEGGSSVSIADCGQIN